tara:strand:- start:6475 stop:7215 length:741 start_codon:yes stop_codon:yes gene_type:complete
MIKFFRQIRKNTIMKNETGKYLKYAIGEITLVVIGILIALQINNWNENIKKDTLKASYITSLIDDYTKDTIQLNNSIKGNNIMFKNLDSISQLFYSEKSNLEDFRILFKNFNRLIRVTNTYNTNSFKVLISSGNIDLFDKELVEALMELNRVQNAEIEVSGRNSDIYLGLMTSMANEFPIFSSNTGSKSTKLLKWKSANLNKLPVNMTNIIRFKQYVISRYLELTGNVLIKTEYALELLNTRLKDD